MSLATIAALRILALGVVVSSAGCLSPCSVNPKSYPALPDSRVDPAAAAKPDPLAGAWHGFRVSPDPDLEICRWQKLNPVWWFGNQDEPVPPAWYRPGEHLRTFLWHLRNPMHNFNHYVIGIKDKESVRSGRYPRAVSKPGGGWNFAVSKYKHLRLPFIDYHRGRFEFYLGWRTAGNFGIKCNWHDEHAAKPNPGATAF